MYDTHELSIDFRVITEMLVIKYMTSISNTETCIIVMNICYNIIFSCY